MPDKPTQKFLPFADPRPESHAAAVRYEPSDDALAAYERLEEWLCTPRGPLTDVGAHALYALARALLEGKRGWHHAAEDALETLKLRNGKADGDDIPEGIVAGKGEDFQRDVEDCLDCLHEIMLGN